MKNILFILRLLYIHGDAINYSKAKSDTSVMHTMSKLLSHIRYVEKEFDIIVLDRTRRTADRRKKNCA